MIVKDEVVQQIMASVENDHDVVANRTIDQLPVSAPIHQIRSLIDALKKEGDHLRMEDVHRAQTLAQVMLAISRHFEDAYCMGISWTALANCASSIGRAEQAWDYIGRAAVSFDVCHDALGWARTCITRLILCANVKKVDDVLVDTERARAIFQQHHEYEYLLRLEANIGWLMNQLGRYAEASVFTERAVVIADQHAETLGSSRGQILLIKGYSQGHLGQIQAAIDCYAQAAQSAREYNQLVIEINANLSVAFYLVIQGQYRQALRQLYQLRRITMQDDLAVEHVHVRLAILQAYQELNRYQDITRQTPELLAAMQKIESMMLSGRASRYLGIAHMYLQHAPVAMMWLKQGFERFNEMGNDDEVRITQYWLAEAAFQRGDVVEAEHILQQCLQHSQTESNRLEYGQARLLLAWLRLAAGDFSQALDLGQTVFHDARQHALKPLQYQAMRLMATVYERMDELSQAVDHYETAMSIMEQSHQYLTVGLYPNYLKDKAEVVRALIRIYRKQGDAEKAYQTLIRGRAQAMSQYVEQDDALRWDVQSEEGRQLIQERGERMAQFNLLFRQIYYPHTLPADAVETQKTDAQAQLAQLENEIINITEQLQLLAQHTLWSDAVLPSLAELQEHLPEDSVMLQYYVDRHHWSVFVIRKHHIEVVALPIAPPDLTAKVAEVRSNIDFANSIPPTSPASGVLKEDLLSVLNDLYQALITPIEAHINEGDQIFVVPFSDLHQLSFSMLFDGQQYLIEKHETVLLPYAAALSQWASAQGSKSRARDAVILGHSWNNRLPYCVQEARTVYDKLSTLERRLYKEEEAVQQCLQGRAGSILHIAAHGMFRADRPELSHIWLADGQLLLDDLLQYDLSYQLIVLTACETGHGQVSGIDELIGVGRGLVLKGAQSLLLTLWQINDETAPEIISTFYDQLIMGKRKSAALQAAQVDFINTYPAYHPAYWGAFQFIGNSAPLF